MESSMFPDDWTGVLKVAIKACREGRRVLLDHFGRLQQIEKKFQAGLVSEADRLAEQVIGRTLKHHYPQIEILGEEAFAAGERVPMVPAGPRGRWILDPLDGTTNYIHRFPIYCISLALEVNSDLKIAVIDVPVLGETYTAIRGRGAFVNGRPLRVSETDRLEDSLLATGFFAEDKEGLKEQVDLFTRVVGDARGVRRAGAAAYDLCQVASGVFDGFWERNLKPWDVAAGQLLVEEAGGQIVTYEGGPHDPYSAQIVAGNKKIVPLLVERFQSKK